MNFNYSMVNRSGRRALMSAYLLRDKNDVTVGEIKEFTFPMGNMTRVEYRHLNQSELCPGLEWALSRGSIVVTTNSIFPMCLMTNTSSC